MFKRLFDALSLAGRRALPSRCGLASQRPLRVGVSVGLARIGQMTGVGRIWSTGIDRLGHTASIILDPGDYSVKTRPDVWLSDGHQGAIVVPEPVVALVFEARWVEPRLAADLDPAFLSWIGPNTVQAVRQATRVLTISFASARNIAQLGVGADRIRRGSARCGLDHIPT